MDQRDRPFASIQSVPLRLDRRLSSAEMMSSDLAEVVNRAAEAVFFVNAAGRVTFMNGAAEVLAARRDGLVVDRGELRVAQASATARLRTLLSAAAAAPEKGTASGGAVVLPRSSGRRGLCALITPLSRRHRQMPFIDQSVAMVIVTDPEDVPTPDQETIRAMFGLTPAEARLTRVLAQGMTVTQAASHLGWRVETTRTRLKTIFEKTGTHRQAALVRLVLNAAVRL